MRSTIKPKTFEMPLAEWLDNEEYPYWPNERDYVAHSRKLLNWSEFDPHHPTLGQEAVLIHVRETGVTYKGNNMTTTHLHKEGKAFFPGTVRGLHYSVPTMTEGQIVYKAYDPRVSQKGAKDILNSALKANGIVAKSKTFASGNGTTGASIAFHALAGKRRNDAHPNMEHCVSVLKKSLKATDEILALAEEIKAGKTAKSAPIIAAMILTYRRAIRVPDHEQRDIRVKEWREFWTRFVRSGGEKGEADAVHNTLWNKLSLGMAGSGGSRELTFKWTERALYCFDCRAKGVGKKLLRIPLTEYCVLRMVAGESANVGSRTKSGSADYVDTMDSMGL